MYFIPALSVALLAFSLIWAHAIQQQNRIALQYRLQVCAVRAAAARRDFLHRVVTINQTMIPLQLAVYAGRGTRLIPGVNIATGIAEAAALILLRTLKVGREGITFAQTVREISLFPCRASRYSASPAWCRWKPATRNTFEEDLVLFPDVPRTVSLPTDRKDPVFTCEGLLGLRYFREAVVLKGGSHLLVRNFKYDYQSRK